MAAKYINITSGPRTTLLEKNTVNTATQYNGLISSIYVSNNSSATNTTIAIWIEDYDTAAKFFFIKDIVIPGNTAFELSERVSFDVNKYKLIIDHTSSSLDLTVRIE
jgi:hypothetical protein